MVVEIGGGSDAWGARTVGKNRTKPQSRSTFTLDERNVSYPRSTEASMAPRSTGSSPRAHRSPILRSAALAGCQRSQATAVPAT